MKKGYLLLLCAMLIAGCGDRATYTQRENPNNAFKDYKGHEKSVIGVGETISKRKEKVNSVVSYKGTYSLLDAVDKLSKRYALSVDWDDAVNKYKEKRLTASEQKFNEARAYLEDVFGVSIIRVRDRAIKILMPGDAKKVEMFNPGPNVALARAVNGLAEVCDINLVIAEYKDVLQAEKITTNLKNITCDKAFEAILDPFGLSLEERGGHYTIGGLPYKEWVLDLHEQKRKESQSVNYSSEMTGTSSSGDGDTGEYISGGSSSTSVTYSRDLWTSLEKDLKELVAKSCEDASSATSASSVSSLSADSSSVASTSDREVSCGYVRVNPDVGVVQMQAPRRVISQADNIIEKIEEIASRRLLINARVLAVTKTRSFERGADLSLKSGSVGVGFNPTQSLRNASVASTLNDLLNNGTDTLSGGGFALDKKDIDAVVRYVESFGTTYQLMKPTLEVMDRQRSTLIDGRNERYFIREGEIDNSGDTPVVTTESEEKVQFVGIQFAVSAQIAEDKGDLHTVSLQIPITEIVRYESLETLVGQKDPLVDQIPIATTRVIDQKVRIRDDEIKVIGGITRTIAVDKETGVPLLQEVPVAGNAFSEESVTYEEAEFVVLLQVKKLD